MDTFVVRLWLPDRPGALGQVASRIGAVHGDVVGIKILERRGVALAAGRAGRVFHARERDEFRVLGGIVDALD